MSTDFRALCAELLQPLAEYDSANPYHEHRALITRARAALAAELVGEGPAPTHEQISQWINTNPVLRPGATGGPMIRVGTDWLAAFADAVRWGAQFRPATPPAPEPGEVAELVAVLLADAKCLTAERPDLMQLTSQQLTRAATLLQQLDEEADQ